MFEPFLIAFREAFQCAVILGFILIYPKIKDRKAYYISLFAGVFAAFISGSPLGYFPNISKLLWDNKTWTFWRYISEITIFYLSIVFVILKIKPSVFAVSSGLFILGFFLFLFEARAVGFLIRDIGAMKGTLNSITVVGLAGIIAGFAPLFFLKKSLTKIHLKGALTLSSLLLLTGALKFAFGGVSGIEDNDLLITLQRGLLIFLEGAVKHMQSVLLIPEHPFISVPFAGLARFLSGDRTAVSLMVIFIMFPPLFVLISLFARPDPIVNDTQVKAQKRLKIAFFRTELIYQTIPVLFSFLILVILIHSANISMNPLYEPVPAPVREGENPDLLMIPLSDKFGDFTDGKLRKYVYYYGNKQIIFLAILKADGSVGVALDECEICRPAEWNKDARGYAQKGDHLICKYCMTPIALPTINNPGGCNPIPIPFKIEDKNIAISLTDLINTHKFAEALDKKGTHL